jgi:3-phosphoshikimate 1-carboxyvinyltransferase
VHHAGTAMRFLTAYFAQNEGCEVVLTGSNRMKERPIQILVDALNDLGANISYLEKEGFPPIKIKGKKLNKSQVSLKANVSSQYISALLMIAPSIENGLELTLEGEITSLPYIQMTLALLNEMGVEIFFDENAIYVKPKSTIQNVKFVIESDWSSASYFYSIVALSEIGTHITLSSFKENSLQGDSVLVTIYKNFGVETIFKNNQITILKVANCTLKTLNLNLSNAPDIAQTIAVTCLGLGISCELTGLHTLKIKETDRLLALQNEISKFGPAVFVTNDTLILQPHQISSKEITIKTYQDHRMAMAFAPLALLTPLQIEDAEVVSKSFPDFWEKLKTLGFEMTYIRD